LSRKRWQPSRVLTRTASAQPSSVSTQRARSILSAPGRPAAHARFSTAMS
jgi:hypothetical protein